MGSVQDLIEKLMHREVLKIIAEDQADDMLQPHTPEVQQQKKEANLKTYMQILGPEGVTQIKHIIRTLILKPLMTRDLWQLIDDEVWRETMNVGLYPEDDDEDWDDVISTVMYAILEEIRDAAEEILDA